MKKLLFAFKGTAGEYKNMMRKVECPQCEGKGVYPVADGPEDFVMTACACTRKLAVKCLCAEGVLEFAARHGAGLTISPSMLI